MKGLDLCRTLQNDPQTAKIPIIVVSVTRHEVDSVLSLEIGADDYLAEPFNIKELVARIRAVLRRTRKKLPDTKVLEKGEIVIDKEKCIVYKNGKKISLTAQSYRLLCFLAERQGKVFSREQLLVAVWNNTALSGLRTIDVHIRKLRQRLEQQPSHPQYIKTLRGIGYYFDHEQTA
jgi:DNA-binding response OmpR family regulator